MTLIAYSAGLLLADSVAEDVYDSLSAKVKMNKLHVSPTGHFAFAHSGDKLLRRNMEQVHDALAFALIKTQILDQEWVFKILDKDKLLFTNGQFIILSHDRVWCSDREDPTQPFFELELDDTIAFGVTAPSFRVALAAGMKPELAAEKACCFTYGCNKNEVGLQVFKQSKLKPIPARIPAKKKESKK